MKKLYLSKTNKKLFGICGGIAEYFNIDPTLVRLLWIAAIMSGSGIIAYIVCFFIVPEKPDFVQ